MTVNSTVTPRWTVSRVGVWGACGTGNLGNEMTMAAIIQNLRRLRPDIHLRAFSADPQDTFERYGIPSFPMMQEPSGGGGHRLSRLVRRAHAPFMELSSVYGVRQSLEDLDLFVFAGTGILTDSWGGPARFPYNVFKWTRLADWSGAKVAVVSAGAGPLDSRVSRCLVRSALDRTAYRSFRDDYSRELVESLGGSEDNHVCPDLAFSLTVPASGAPPLNSQQREVAIIGMPFRKPGRWENPDGDVYRGYLEAMASLTSSLLAEGYTIRLVPTHVRADAEFIHDLRAVLDPGCSRRYGDRLLTEATGTFEQLIEQLSRVHMVVSSRFHGVVFAYLVGTPVLGVSYHPKMNSLMESFGQQAFCLDLTTVKGADLREAFSRLVAGWCGARDQIQRTVSAHRQALAEQYTTLLQL